MSVKRKEAQDDDLDQVVVTEHKKKKGTHLHWDQRDITDCRLLLQEMEFFL